MHLHSPAKDLNELLLLRENAPELYATLIKSIDKDIDAKYIERTYPHTEPARLIKTGRRYGLAVALAVLGLAGYSLYLGEEWFAGIIVALDIVGLTAVFSSGKSRGKQQNSETQP